LGTFPSAVLVARSRGIDILREGSGNPGASNVGRVLGGRWGAMVFALDAVKGALPAGVGLLSGSRPAAYLLVTAAVLGHMFPITRRFHGGKGVATMGGAVMVLHPLISLALLVLWAVVRRTTHKASLASLIITVGLPIAVAVRGARGWEVTWVIALCALVLARHADNIRRLLSGSELPATQP
jgi:glycerol-3-phosphate acyltransferase PlsY